MIVYVVGCSYFTLQLYRLCNTNSLAHILNIEAASYMLYHVMYMDRDTREIGGRIEMISRFH